MPGILFLVAILVIIVGLVQLPLIFDLIRSCAPSIAPKRLVGPVLDTILTCVMMVVFGAVFHLYFWVFLPAHISDPWLDNAGLLHIFFFYTLFLNAVANYVCSVFTPPGSPPKITMTPDTAMSISIESCIPKEKICVECKCIKADTTHHCSICKQCILHMDHHCPFVMGCVGLNNYHYFYTFMINFYIGMVYSMYMMFGPFIHCHGLPYDDRTYDCDHVGTISILFVIVGFNIIGATLMNTFNILALLSNVSTMSCLIETIRSGFSSSTRHLFSQLTLTNLTNPRSRINVILLSKRKHVAYFLVPPGLTALRLLVKHAASKKRTIKFKFPKLPKSGGLIA